MIPEVSEADLATMIGTLQSSASFIMDRFHKFGFVGHNGLIGDHQALLKTIHHDQMPGDSATKPAIFCIPREEVMTEKRARSKRSMRYPANARL
jgi:hypothetical protein